MPTGDFSLAEIRPKKHLVARLMLDGDWMSQTVGGVVFLLLGTLLLFKVSDVIVIEQQFMKHAQVATATVDSKSVHRANRSTQFLDVFYTFATPDGQEISGQVAAQLEVEDPVPGSYTLEVSSPGLDRRLTRESHFVQFTGRKARVTTHQPFQGRRKFLGQIEGFAEGKIVLSTEDGGTVEIPLEDVARARLEVEL